MKSRVNLYAAEFRPTLRLFTLSLCLSCCMMIIVLFGLWFTWAKSEQHSLQGQLAALEQQKKQQSGVVKALQAELANIKKDPALLNEVELNSQLLALKKRILAELLGQEDLKSNGFSKLMLELGNHHQAGLWLTHIGLDGREVTLEGAANESDSIPKWLNGLGNTAYFKGQQFAETRLYRDSEQQLNFIIATTPLDGRAANGGARHD